MSDALAPDPQDRDPVVADPGDPGLAHLGVVGDTYTVLLSGEDTDGRYAMIDMLVPPGGGPPPHRHAFEELFYVLEGELEMTVRDKVVTVPTGSSVNIPALAPHRFVNVSDAPARMLCVVVPAGLERVFHEIGDPVSGRAAPAPSLEPAEIESRLAAAAALQAELGIETLVGEA